MTMMRSILAIMMATVFIEPATMCECFTRKNDQQNHNQHFSKTAYLVPWFVFYNSDRHKSNRVQKFWESKIISLNDIGKISFLCYISCHVL